MRRLLLVAVSGRVVLAPVGARLDVARRRRRPPAVLLRSGAPVRRGPAPRYRHRRDAGKASRARRRHGDFAAPSRLGPRVDDHDRRRLRRDAHAPRLDRASRRAPWSPRATSVGTVGPSGDSEVPVPYVHLGVRVAAERAGLRRPARAPARARCRRRRPAPARRSSRRRARRPGRRLRRRACRRRRRRPPPPAAAAGSRTPAAATPRRRRPRPRPAGAPARRAEPRRRPRDAGCAVAEQRAAPRSRSRHARAAQPSRPRRPPVADGPSAGRRGAPGAARAERVGARARRRRRRAAARAQPPHAAAPRGRAPLRTRCVARPFAASRRSRSPQPRRRLSRAATSRRGCAARSSRSCARGASLACAAAGRRRWQDAARIMVVPCAPTREEDPGGAGLAVCGGPRHLGHVAGFGVPSDVFARYHRLQGQRRPDGERDRRARDAGDGGRRRKGSPTREVADYYNARIREDFRRLGITYDCFTRTTTPNHERVTQDLFRTLYEHGAIVERTQLGLVLPDHRAHAPGPLHRGDVPDLRLSRGARRPVRQLRQPARPDRPDRSALEDRRLDARVPRDEPPLPRPAAVRRGAARAGSARTTTGGRTSATSRSGWSTTSGRVRSPATSTGACRIPVPGYEEDPNKRIYVWFDAVIGYLSASIEWARDARRTGGVARVVAERGRRVTRTSRGRTTSSSTR